MRDLSSQERANIALRQWQAQRDKPPAERVIIWPGRYDRELAEVRQIMEQG